MEQRVIARTTQILAFAVLLGAAPSVAVAQDANSQKSYEVSSLQLSSLPVPTSRSEALKTANVKSPAAEPAEKIRRTASGIRIVGPVYFPTN